MQPRWLAIVSFIPSVQGFYDLSPGRPHRPLALRRRACNTLLPHHSGYHAKMIDEYFFFRHDSLATKVITHDLLICQTCGGILREQ